MFKNILIAIAFLNSFILNGQNNKDSGNEGLIKIIYPNYFQDIKKQGWTNYFDEDFKATITSVDTFLIEPERSDIFAAINWSSIDYTYGEMTEFFVLPVKKNKPTIKGEEQERLYYGGGTQRYDYPTVTKIIKLTEKGYLFLVEQGSYHFASNTSNKMLYAYAAINNKIKLVYSEEIENGFDRFSLENIEIDELFSNIDEYIPHEYMRENISETKIQYKVIENQNNNKFEKLILETTLYNLVNKEVVKKVSQQTFFWNGNKLVESN